MPQNHTVEILSGRIPSNPTQKDTLDIYPDHTLRVNRGDSVSWFVADGKTNVASFRIRKKNTSPQIFSGAAPVPGNHTRRGSGRVSSGASRGSVYEYSIFWKPKGSNEEYEHDPKIAVNTNLVDNKDNLLLMTAIGLTALGLMAFFLFSTRKSKSKNVKNIANAQARTDFSE